MPKQDYESANRNLWAKTMTNKGLHQAGSFDTHRLGGRQTRFLLLVAIAVVLAVLLSALILMRFGTA